MTETRITGYELKTNRDLLDLALELLCCQNDAALARELHVMPPVISKIRHGYLGFGAKIQLRMLDLGIPLTTIRQYVPSSIPK